MTTYVSNGRTLVPLVMIVKENLEKFSRIPVVKTSERICASGTLVNINDQVDCGTRRFVGVVDDPGWYVTLFKSDDAPTLICKADEALFIPYQYALMVLIILYCACVTSNLVHLMVFLLVSGYFGGMGYVIRSCVDPNWRGLVLETSWGAWSFAM